MPLKSAQAGNRGRPAYLKLCRVWSSRSITEICGGFFDTFSIKMVSTSITIICRYLLFYKTHFINVYGSQDVHWPKMAGKIFRPDLRFFILVLIVSLLFLV